MNMLHPVSLALGLCLSGIGLCAANDASAGSQISAQVAIDWNERAYASAYAEDQFLTFKGQRAHAMMHLAQHDALNVIEQRFHRYLAAGRQSDKLEPDADARAAAARAAHDVLSSQYPRDQAAFDALLARQLAAIPDSEHKKAGVELGRRTAAAMLAARTDDGIDREGAYEFSKQPGAYQTTPDWKGFVAAAAFGSSRPFVLASAEQFRPAPPPPLASVEYAVAFEEVKRSGAKTRAVRTAEQTGYAVWWMEFAEGSLNRLARKLATDSNMDLWEAARMFALLNATLVDSYISVWDAKYRFNHWRPYTAIRAAASDGNPSTVADVRWESLRPAPPFPEYPSAHAAGCASAFRVLEEFFPNVTTFTMDSKTAPAAMPARSFASFRAAAHECADSRVQLGFHFRYAVDAGAKMGRQIAEFGIAQRLQPSTR
jgi:hypothetical protein